MEKDCYQEIINEGSKTMTDKVISEEKDLVVRSTLIDGDIADLVQSIGLKRTQRVLENTLDEIIKEKKEGMDDSQKSNNRV